MRFRRARERGHLCAIVAACRWATERLRVLGDGPRFSVVLIAGAIATSLLLASVFVGRRGKRADTPRRCRSSPASPSLRTQPSRFSISYYLTAMLFIVFDIEIVFLYAARGASCGSSQLFGFVELLVVRRAARRSATSTSGAREHSSGSDPARAPHARSARRDIEDVVMTTTVEKVLNWASSNSIWPFGFGLACCAMEMIAMRDAALRRRPLRLRGHPRDPAPDRPADRLRAASRTGWQRRSAALRADARAQVGAWRWAPARRPAACSRTTRSCRASTRSSRSTSTCPAARRARRP